MINDELTTADVLADPLKNLSNVFEYVNEDNDGPDSNLIDNEYYTESDFIEFTKKERISVAEHPNFHS